jgi:hypothetical protein
MFRNKKRLSLVLLLFFITIIGGAAYASIFGYLTYRVSVTFPDKAELIFTEATSSANSASGKSQASYTIDPTGQIMTFDVLLTEPGESVTLSYHVVNTGNSNVKIIDSQGYALPANVPLRLTGDHEYSAGGRLWGNPEVIIAPNASIKNCKITFEFEENVNNEYAASITFDVKLQYMYTTEPATVLP